MNRNKKIITGMSGGVDSSVAAWLLKEQGYDVTGLFMINWHERTGTLTSECSWEDDLTYAKLIAKQIGIDLHVVDLSEHYRKRVVDYMFTEYEKGRTPNPDVLCNREIKFDLFIDEAKKLGADLVATGHYARKETIKKNGKEYYRLLAGRDKNKDQSYFLCQLSQEQLKDAIFPIGEIEKPEVRRIAEENGLASADKKDSQGICFVGKVDLPVFLQQQLKPKEGNIVEINPEHKIYKQIGSDKKELVQPFKYADSDGKVIGRHQGAYYFTVGQRRGLDVSGTPEPLFVIGSDISNNIVFVGQGKKHPGLFRKGLKVLNENLHWVRPDLEMNTGDELQCRVRIRYRQPLQVAAVHKMQDGLYIIFDEKQRGITPGQFAALYIDDELVASGEIEE